MVKQLTCDADLQARFDEKWHPWPTEYTWPHIRKGNEFDPRIDDPAFDILRCSLRMIDEELERDMGEYAFGIILCLTPNLQALYISFPTMFVAFRRWESRGRTKSCFEKLGRLIATVTANRGVGKPHPLENLRCLRFYMKCGADYPWRVKSRLGGDSRQCEENMCPALLGAPNLASLQSICLHFGATGMIPRGLKSVTLNMTTLTSKDLDAILDLPYLQELTLYALYEESWENPRSDGDYFNTQLAKRAKHKLNRLAITIIQNLMIQSRWDLFGPRRYLHCIADFTVLRELDVDLLVLVAHRGNMKNVQLEARLPASLRKLTLREQWRLEPPKRRRPKCFGTKYAKDRADMMRRFARSCKARCADLTTVHWVAWQTKEGDEIVSGWDLETYSELVGLFAAANVAFECAVARRRLEWSKSDSPAWWFPRPLYKRIVYG